ncbi:MAG: hypothetical protein CMN27_08000 [Salinisphaera sp.]|nr:hypothetical protein [Salinisphaera sp.]
MNSRVRLLSLSLACAALVVGCNSSGDSDEVAVAPPGATPAEQTGRWVTGDLHVHTALSGDARSPLSDVLKHAFDDFDLDYVSLSNHMRNDSQDNNDNDLGGLLYYKALTEYELPGVERLQKSDYPDRLIYSSFEWDMPTHEHYNVGILWNEANKAERLAAIKQFEYRFSNKNQLSDFNAADVQAWQDAGIERQNQTHEDAVAALEWLQQTYPKSSYGMLNHPLRYASSYTIEDVRELNDAAPDVFFLVEGMVGNQFNGNRGDYGSRSADGVHGGTDPVVSELGGWWDALLGEGRRVWNMANSDHHFKTRPPYASGYYPGEYAKNYTWVAAEEGERLTSQTLLDALRTGRTFSVFGDLIDALDFHAERVSGDNARMGDTLTARRGDLVTVTVRFKQPATNNRELTVNDGNYDGTNPGVHHIDVIAGDVGTKAEPGTAAYSKQTNDSTRVVKSYTADDWYQDDDGYYAVTYSFTADRDQYLRLRGTNLDYNVEGLTVNGEPQRSDVVSDDNYFQYYEKLNERNYTDVWFYSNPIFVSVEG